MIHSCIQWIRCTDCPQKPGILKNLAVRFVADSVNLWTKLLPRSFRILIERRLNPIVVLVKQRTDLPLLFRRQLQIFRKASKFLVDRLRRMDLKLLTR
jgi:hypothetical protein